MKSQLSNQEWEALLRKLSAGEIPDSEIGSAIVHLSKPLDPQRVAAAKETVLRYLSGGPTNLLGPSSIAKLNSQ
jgi:hypothetical protein